MFVCLCAQVNESQWWDCLERCQRDWTKASMECGAGQGCGQCRPFLQEISRLYVEQAAALEAQEDLQKASVDANSNTEAPTS